MGGSTSSPRAWDAYATASTAGTQRGSAAAYTSTTMVNELDPKGVKIRESRDSVACPESNAIMINLDVTGSMGPIADYMIRDGLPTLIKELYGRRPVSDPHIMIGAVDDVLCHSPAPFQVTQFEADIVLIDQLKKIWMVYGGGGNGSESYTLPWYFAAMKTSIDCFEKRGKKGYLFTIGDDGPPPPVTSRQFESVFGPGEYQDMTSEQIYTLVSRMYNVYHIMVGKGGSHEDRHAKDWTKLIGEHAILLSDYEKVAEVIVSLIQVNEGMNVATVAKSWSGDTSLVVSKALGGLTTKDNAGSKKGVTVF